MIIGIVGQNCSGKDTVADILSEYGFSTIDLGDLVREEARRRGESTEREVIIPIANEVRAAEGPGAWAARAVVRIESSGGDWAVSSIRHPKEVEILRQLPGFVLWNVTTSAERRHERALARGRDKVASTLEEFKEKERLENKSSGDTVQRISDCEALADETLTNDSTIEDLKKRVSTLIDDGSEKA
ncbi:MAG: hypothetical protein DRP42_04600 [Tenericutes bacterium]|nr:MAG: hypothetical protein DRP42_04600 [Mycoplasmatota bacterium]